MIRRRAGGIPNAGGGSELERNRDVPVRPATTEERAKAARYTASQATDAADLAQLLDALGLNPAEGRTP